MPQTSSFGTSNVFTLIAWPGGTEQAGSYSLRGGSWDYGPRWVRAASGSTLNPPDSRHCRGGHASESRLPLGGIPPALLLNGFIPLALMGGIVYS